MLTKLGAIVFALSLCLTSWASAQVRPDSSALVILAANTTDHEFEMWVKRDSSFYPVGRSLPNTNMIWVIPSLQMSSKDTLAVIMWVLVGTHQMQADTLSRR